MGFENSLPNLLCEEDESSFINYFGDKEDDYLQNCCLSESDSEFIQLLFRKETNFRFENDANNPVRREIKWLQSARSNVVKWILQKRALFGYHYRTAYLSLIYFDRFLARTWISEGKAWHVRILSIACLSLAAKMEEQQAQALTEYSMDGWQIEGRLIQRMELIVLNTLEWNMTSVTPFSYLYYFVAKFCGESMNKPFVIGAAELILEIMEEINVAEHRPSIVAAAAVLAAYDYGLKKTDLENKMDSIPSWGSFENEHAFSCYCLMQEILKLNTPKSEISLNSLSSDVAVHSTITSRGRRRRLDFNSRDQHCPAGKAPRS